MFKRAYTFDDIALVPQYNNIISRLEPDLSTWLTKDIKISMPLIPANMDCVIGDELADVIIERGGMPFFHRFSSIETQKGWIEKYQDKAFYSVGLDWAHLDTLVQYGAKNLVFDIAHGHSNLMINQISKCKSAYPEVTIIAGNICTAQGYVDLVNAGADAIKCGVGPGCLGADTRVLMGTGLYKNIKDVQIGDFVINKFGQPVKVIGKKNSGIRKVIKIRTNTYPDFTYVTTDHQFNLIDCSNVSMDTIIGSGVTRLMKKQKKTKPKTDRISWTEIGNVLHNNQKYFITMPSDFNFQLKDSFEIDLSDYLVQGKVLQNTIITKNQQTVEFTRYLRSNYNLGYMFGLFLGDGCSRMWVNPTSKCESGSVRWYFNSTELDIVGKLTEIITEFGFNSTIKRRDNVLGVSVYNKCLSKLFLEMGKRHEKHLPEKYYCSDKEYIKGLLDGLTDSDGHVEKDSGRTGFTNTSKSLMELYSFCCFSLNKSFSFCKRKSIEINTRTDKFKGCKFKDSWSIRQHLYNRNPNEYTYGQILDAEECDIELETWDIEVDCPTHSFIANNCIVHNSACTTRSTTGFGVPQFTAIYDCAEQAKKYKIPIIADGGIRNSRDVAIALAAGACSVMVGKLFALTYESSAKKTEKRTLSEKGWSVATTKCYRGQASLDFQNELRGGLKPGTVPEGEHFWAPVTKSANEVIDELLGGLRSAMTYGGARTIQELQRKAEFVEVNPNSYGLESSVRKD